MNLIDPKSIPVENELPKRLRRMFKLADADKDATLDTEEVYKAFKILLR